MQFFNSCVCAVFVLFVLGAGSFAPGAPWPGSGTITDPYQIDEPNELIYLGGQEAYYSDAFILTADIDLTGRTFSEAVIAREGYDAFDGVFDGNHHKILNMTIDAQATNSSYLGLFGQTDINAVIKNLGLENVDITGGAGSDLIGTMAGYFMYGTISNCYTAGTIIAGGGSNIGGFIGASQSGITDCYADVDVTAASGSQYVGGFCGISLGQYSNCYAAGSVSGGIDVHGFVGYSVYASSFYFVHCYHLHPDDGGGPIDSNAAVLTDAQMRDQANFAGWDFFRETNNGLDEAWKMDGYPVLSWQVPVGLEEFSMLGQYWGQSGFSQVDPPSRADWYTDGAVDMSDLQQLAAYWLEPVVQKVYPLAPGDDFETGDFTKQPWVMGGDADWVIDDVTVQQGSYSARSGVIGDSSSSSLELTVDTTGYDLITFYYKVSSEEGFDNFIFYINGSPRITHSGDSGGWLYRTFPVYDGLTTFKWVYSKDGSRSGGEDAAWVDTIVFTLEGE